MPGRGGRERTQRGAQAGGERVGRVSVGRVPVVVTVVVVGYLLFSLSGQFVKLARMESQVRGMQQQVESLQVQNQSLQSQLQNIKSDAYIEQVARQKLGLIKPGEYPVQSVPAGGNSSN